MRFKLTRLKLSFNKLLLTTVNKINLSKYFIFTQNAFILILIFTVGLIQILTDC